MGLSWWASGGLSVSIVIITDRNLRLPLQKEGTLDIRTEVMLCNIHEQNLIEVV